MMKTEKVILARVYKQDGELGIEFTGDGNAYEIKYFLESYLSVSRIQYESNFEPQDFEGDWGAYE